MAITDVVQVSISSVVQLEVTLIITLLVGNYFKHWASFYYRGVEKLASRRAHNPKVVGSNPTPAILI